MMLNNSKDRVAFFIVAGICIIAAIAAACWFAYSGHDKLSEEVLGGLGAIIFFLFMFAM